MSEDHFERLFRSFESTAFRLESLPRYKIEGSGEEERFRSYLNGQPVPSNEDNEWLSSLKKWGNEGKEISRLRILPDRPEPYINFEIEWGYCYNVSHGENIYLISKSKFVKNFDIDLHDFWLFDNQEAIKMVYDDEGGYEDSTLIDDIPREYFKISKQYREIGLSLREYLSWKRNNPQKIDLPQ